MIERVGDRERRNADTKEKAVYVVNPTGSADSAWLPIFTWCINDRCARIRRGSPSSRGACPIAHHDAGRAPHGDHAGAAGRHDWHSIDPALVLAQGDRVRFRFRTNFDGYLYVMNQSTSGKYEQLFPRDETGQDNRIAANQGLSGAGHFRRVPHRRARRPRNGLLAGEPGAADRCAAAPRAPPPRSNGEAAHPDAALRRCRAAGARRLRRPFRRARSWCRATSSCRKISRRRPSRQRDLLFMRQQDTAVISSTAPLTGPVIYEFRLAHR